MDEAAEQRSIGNLADGLVAVTREDIIERSVSHFRQADPEFGNRVAAKITALQLLRQG